VKFDDLRVAAVAWGPGQPLVIEQVEVAPPGPMEIRVKVVSTSVCRSDVTAWQSKVRTSASFAFFRIEAKCELL
jgi:alcohol dehydrogenase